MKPKSNLCRFCKRNSLVLLYAANNKQQVKKPDFFACTNCGYGVHGPIRKCSHCGMIYVDEPISQKKISQFYQFSEDPVYLAQQKAREATFRNYLKNLEKMSLQKGKLLDVGTNTGLFVKVARDANWQAQGLEPNDQAVKYAREHFGIDLIAKPFEKNTFPPESFDVITMWDVIEHFTNPVDEMAKVFRSLKRGGMFAFSTVDPDSFMAKLSGSSWVWYMEMHRVLLGKSASRLYLEKTGFRNIVFRPHFRNLSLGYLATRLPAISPLLGKLVTELVDKLAIEKVVVPYYANDLYDCYAFK